MNYIYDILLDFNDNLYDFFDWNEGDKIIHIRKIPLFKVSAINYNKIQNNKIVISNEFQERIRNKTEMFESQKVTNLDYACLICNGVEVMALLFDKNGMNIKYSSLLIDENDEVVEVSERIDEDNFKFKLLEKNKHFFYLTRLDINIINYVNSEIEKMKNDKNLGKIKFLYYELFDEKNDDINFIITEIKNKMANYKNEIYLKIYKFLKLASMTCSNHS